MAKASTTKQAARKKAQVSPAVKQGKLRMREAWRSGNAIKKIPKSKDGKTQTKEIRRKSGGNASRAEQLRKYRQIARQITWRELNEICNACEDHNRPWGPTFLVELSRIAYASERKAIYTTAIANRWSLLELKRHVQLTLGLSESTDSGTSVKDESGSTSGEAEHKRKRVGRKRKLDWNDETQVLFEVRQLCLGLIRFREDMELEEEKLKVANPGKKVMPDASIEEDFISLLDGTTQLEKKILNRLGELQEQDRPPVPQKKSKKGKSRTRSKKK